MYCQLHRIICNYHSNFGKGVIQMNEEIRQENLDISVPDADMKQRADRFRTGDLLLSSMRL